MTQKKIQMKITKWIVKRKRIFYSLLLFGVLLFFFLLFLIQIQIQGRNVSLFTILFLRAGKSI
jgi:hypothetical protein